MSELDGKQLGPYRVVAQLGEGGMAKVFKAYQASVDRYVALKVLPQSLAKDPQFVERFKQEAQLLARLQHPHILPVHDYGESEGYTYIAMPFIESGTLTDLMRGQPLPLDRAASIIAQVGDALDYAHSQGLVHRDVKPSNVLIDQRGNCLLTDFGIAKMMAGTQHLTSTGAVMGTPAYMSPEQGRGDRVDARSDIYALGIILYELVTGRVPFKAETPLATIFKHIQDPLPLPHLFNPALPEAVERIILKALAKQPEDRYATAGEMVRALQATVNNLGLATAAVPLGPAAPEPTAAISATTPPPVAAVPPAGAAAKPAGVPVYAWVALGCVGVILVLIVVGGMAGGLALMTLRPAPAPTPVLPTPTVVIEASATPEPEATRVPTAAPSATAAPATTATAAGEPSATPLPTDTASAVSPTDTPGASDQLPADVPLYPNAKPAADQSLSGALFGIFTYSTSDSLDAVAKFYTAQLPKNDWKLDNDLSVPNSDPPSALQLWSKGNNQLLVTITTQNKETVLMLTLTSK